MNYQYRYLARAVLVPFVYKPPKITVGVLDHIRTHAPAAIPQLLKVISSLSSLSTEDINSTVSRIEELLGSMVLDGRLLVQYALSIIYAQMVN